MYHGPLLELSRIFGMYHGIHESKRMHVFSHIFSPKEGRALRMRIKSSRVTRFIRQTVGMGSSLHGTD
jgi:hypothetical protein